MTGAIGHLSRPFYAWSASCLMWLRRDRRAAISLGYLIVLLLVAISAHTIAPHSITEQNLSNALAGPSWSHPLGTDDLGRDAFSRLIGGAPITLFGAFLAVSIATLIGIPLGLIAGFAGGWTDEMISRLIDTLLSFPSIVLAIGVTGALGIGLVDSMIAIGIVFSPTLARLVRARTLVVKSELYIDVVRAMGGSRRRILLLHILPNTVQPALVQMTLLLAEALLAEAGLSFLGLGVQPPQPSWGAMLARAYSYMDIAPQQMLVPGVAIMLAALAFNTLGESLHAALDPNRLSS